MFLSFMLNAAVNASAMGIMQGTANGLDVGGGVWAGLAI
jgi:hypothetical protein